MGQTRAIPTNIFLSMSACRKIKMQAAKNFLTHINPYTGKAYGEEENIALYEIYNENGFVFKTLSGGPDQWPPYFKGQVAEKVECVADGLLHR